MAPGLLFALTIPGLAVLLVVLAVVERAASGLHRHSPLHARRRHAVSAAGADAFSTALDPGRQVDVDRRLAAELLREDETDGAPPHSRVDLDAGVAHLVLPPR
jgi:Family of unknown function (DUF6191)